ncbi:putative bifunctional diguanylate cyclase/phosphodiesterase [Sphingomonas sp. UNC305MFCol5.2]|uniref:putative bifunctional diguanylate cyclase/phosphodiesterase n=1 Tax=Sphingomonas sp. UNC305MFCol5.2 TaxID=1449076 RepID=UPI00068F9C7E|nr:EAL domain-containing protein [Sphingomonas sp. UNC305MFCol5.2]
MSNLDLSFRSANETILIVDDNPVNLGVVVGRLEQQGYDVLVALGGEEALTRAEFASPDLVLLDVMMPGLDGFETCRRLKANPLTTHIPVIFMTALGDLRDKVAAFEAGGVDYVSKPFHFEELLARIATHLALKAARQSLALQNSLLTQEIAARAEAEAKLRVSEQSYRRLFETAGDGILLLDADSGTVVDANPRFLAMTGQPRGALRGQAIEALPGMSVFADAASMAELRHSGTLRRDEVTLAAADGSELFVDLIASSCEVAGRSLAQYNLRDITDRKQAEAHIRYLALHDALTGLPNRTMFFERLSAELARARRSGGASALLVIDLDHFKQVNDCLGHLVGDQLLQEVSARLLQCLRAADTAARLGGDEFVVALADIGTRERADEVAARILEALGAPFDLDGQVAHISGSIGISLFPEDGDSPRALLQAADTAMYGAKKGGRNTCVRYTHQLDVPGERWRTLSQDVHGACGRGEFEIYYQPQIDLEDGRVVGIESLIRWNHPREGLISPTVFIPLLEERGLMLEVGSWVLHEACRQNAAWQRSGLAPVRIAVNLSAQQFYRGDIVRTVRAALAGAALEPCWLELELTESLTLDDSEATLRIMNELKEIGVALSLDDFGTGWSSLGYLSRFPLDRIKIDRSFVRDMGSHEGTAAIVSSILDLARTLGLDCIAEGVETEEQRDRLRSKDCPSMQGFLFSEPVPAAEMLCILERGARTGPGAIAAASPERA